MVTAPGTDTAIVSRVFAAFHGIDEDPVTGSAHAALVPFWAERLGANRVQRVAGEQALGTPRLPPGRGRARSSGFASAAPPSR